MTKINLLPEQLINQIAAGEVVERPASVVKELLENSLDAGATKIVIEIKNGGVDMIRISDNGCGMSGDDALKCLERHATSKIANLEDLHQVRTMGFRGEAMASIASVSKLKLRTRAIGEESGTEVLTEGGNVMKVTPIGSPNGTEIEVMDLFFNTPARKKFLKSEQTEYQNIVDILLDAALATPNVAFCLINEDKVVFDLAATDDELVRLRNVLGKGIVEEMIPVFYGGVLLNIKGYIGKPSLTRANKNMQYLFVNNRPIKSHVLSYAIKQAYHALIPKERQPVFVIKFELDPSMVDVNCHPRKTEVKFTDEREVYRVLTASCGKALEENILTPKITSGYRVAEFKRGETSNNVGGEKVASTNYYQEKRPEGLAQLTLEGLGSSVNTVVDLGVTAQEVVRVGGEQVLESGHVHSFDSHQHNSGNGYNGLSIAGVTSVDSRETEKAEGVHVHGLESDSSSETLSEGVVNRSTNESRMVVLGQLNNSFILCQRGVDLMIVDQHAAHERIRYNKLMAEGENEEKVIQPLLTPVFVELSQQDITLLNSNKEALEAIGVGVEHFGGNSFAISAIPAFLVKADLEKVLHGLLDDFRAGWNAPADAQLANGQRFKGDLFARKEKILTYLACRSAVKFGDPLSREEMVGLIEQLEMETHGKNTCPHGRPTMIVMESEELWSRFGRKYTGFFEKEKFRDVNC